MQYDFDGLVQDCSVSSALALLVSGMASLGIPSHFPPYANHDKYREDQSAHTQPEWQWTHQHCHETDKWSKDSSVESLI